jgi:PLD-like domain
MPIAIVLRKNELKNPFRDVIITAISSGIADEALMCSGFFQESRKSVYRATLESSFAASCVKNNVKLVTVGIHNSQWLNSYKLFKHNLLQAGVNAHCKYKSGSKWHAKVFIALQQGKPLLGIIGSSNITRPAFSSSAPFNRECDVIIWPEGTTYDGLINDALGTENFVDVVRAPYNQDQNGGITVEERLLSLYNEILADGLVNL